MIRPLAVTIVSGGMDSTSLAFYMQDKGYDQVMLSFDYGQRHKKELESAKKIASIIGCSHHIVDLTSVTQLLGGSSQTDTSVAVPEGHYAKESMAQTVVPNRNAIMLSIAYGAAVANAAEILAYGAHAGDHFIYPDCRPKFVEALGAAFAIGNEGFGSRTLRITAPFILWSKADIVAWGLAHKVPYEYTWTCYKGEEVSCGRCGTCVERRQSFSLNGVEDPIEYVDRDYWKQAIKEFNKV